MAMIHAGGAAAEGWMIVSCGAELLIASESKIKYAPLHLSRYQTTPMVEYLNRTLGKINISPLLVFNTGKRQYYSTVYIV